MTPPTDAELGVMSIKWNISVKRLRFLLSCPHHDGVAHIMVATYQGRERQIAEGISKAIRGSWTAVEAAEFCNGTEDEVKAFVRKHNITWPEGCRLKLAWGGRTTLNHKRAEQGLEAVAHGYITIEQAVILGTEANLTCKETSNKYQLSMPGLYHRAKHMGLRFRPFHANKRHG